MRLVVHVLRIVTEALRYGLATRRMGVFVVLVLGLLLVMLSLTAQTVAPLALYPFA